MNQRSEFILEKMVDYFGEWEEPEVKKSIRDEKPKKTLKKVKKKQVSLIESVVDRQRRAEILMFIDELESINKNESSILKLEKTRYIKQRQRELIHTKQIIKDASQTASFIGA